jgi:hypothetical protein
VKDEYLGKRLKCPECGATFTATAAPRPGKLATQRTPAVHVSKGVIILIIVAIAIPSIFAFWRYGPGKVADDWQKNLPDSEDNVRSVVERGMLAYLSAHGDYDPSSSHNTPHALDVNFLFGPMHFSMPQSVGVVGTTTQGAFTGLYHPHSGEVEADVDIGGLAFTGTGALHRGNKTIHVTGREKESHLTVEVDGQPADIVYRKSSE